MLLVCALAGCAAPLDPPVLDSAVAVAGPALGGLPAVRSYRIGMNTEVTGTGAQIGDLSIRAARLAIEEINAAGGVNGIPLELVVRDCRSDPEVALAEYRRAIADDNLVVLLGPFKSAYAVRIVAEHRQHGLPMFIGATNAALTRQGDGNLFRMRPNDQLTAAAITALAVEQLGRRRVAVVHDADAFGSGGADNVAAELAARSLTPVAREAYRTGARDFDALAQRVAASTPDALLIYGTNTTDVGFLLRALRYWQVDAAIITSPSGATPVAHDIAAEAQDGVYVALDALLEAHPAGQQYVERFIERFHLAPDTYVAWYYDAVYLSAEALAGGAIEPEALSAALRRSQFAGVQGPYRFDQAGEGRHEVVLVQMQGGVASPVAAYSDGALRPWPAGTLEEVAP